METSDRNTVEKSTRRHALVNLFMWAGLIVSYGTGFWFALRYVYPRRGHRRVRSIFFASASELPAGRSKEYKLPDGSQALVTNTGAEIVAISNVCPHLGCKVHWVNRDRHFLCPCHGGVFDHDGEATEGPPADEEQHLKKFPVRRIGNNLFLEVEEIIRL